MPPQRLGLHRVEMRHPVGQHQALRDVDGNEGAGGPGRVVLRRGARWGLSGGS